jgi:hypothetical protein
MPFLREAVDRLNAGNLSPVLHVTLEYLLEHGHGRENPVPTETILTHLRTAGHEMSLNHFQTTYLSETRIGRIFIGSGPRGLFLIDTPEFGTAQGNVARGIDAGAKPRVLAILENFEEWERGVDWNDLDFLFSHGHEIAKIAIVGEPRWEAEALAFSGAGFRKAPLKYFPAHQETEARTWLAE